MRSCTTVVRRLFGGDRAEVGCGGGRAASTAIAVWAAVWLAAFPAWSLTPATLLNPKLEAQPINLAGLSGGTLSYFDDQRRLTQASVAGFVRLSLSAEPMPGQAASDFSSANAGGSTAPAGVIELVDGQRIAGAWAGATRDGEAVVWRHPTLGRFTLGLDDVRRVVIDSAAVMSAVPDAGTAEGDTVWLRNGDALIGFIVAVGDAALTILPDGAADEVTLALENVAAVTLANPLTPSGAVVVAGDLVALADGSRVRGGAVSIQRETLRLTPALTDAMLPVELRLEDVKQIDFASAGLRLVDLGDQPMQTTAGGSAFGLDFLPTVDDGGVRLHAPVTVSFELPEGVQRFAATASLDLPRGLPAARAAWADLELTVEATGGAAGGDAAAMSFDPVRLRADRPEALLNYTLDGQRRLRVEVDPGVNGPVLDRLVLRDAVLLIRVPHPPPGSGNADP